MAPAQPGTSPEKEQENPGASRKEQTMPIEKVRRYTTLEMTGGRRPISLTSAAPAGAVVAIRLADGT